MTSATRTPRTLVGRGVRPAIGRARVRCSIGDRVEPCRDAWHRHPRGQGPDDVAADPPSRASSPSCPAGGAGTRLWPLSRAGCAEVPARPHRRRTHAAAVDLGPARAPGRGTTACWWSPGRAHADAVRAQLPGLPAAENLLGRAVAARLDGRDRAGRRGAGAARPRGRDRLVRRRPRHRRRGGVPGAVAQAVAVAREGWVVTVGIAPTRAADRLRLHPLRAGPRRRRRAGRAVRRRVRREARRRDRRSATSRTAGYRGTRACSSCAPPVLLDHLRAAAAAAARRPGRDRGGTSSGDRRRVRRAGPGLARADQIAIDHAIAEPVAAAGGVAVVPGSFGWDDVGDWDSLPAARRRPSTRCRGARRLGPGASTTAAPGWSCPASGRTVAVVGLDDVVVVDTPDALLVTTRDHAQHVKAVVERCATGPHRPALTARAPGAAAC